MKYKNLMLDLETMSNKGNAAIVSIGAVAFEPSTGEIGPTFYTVVDLISSERAGLHIDADTVLWWMKKSSEARAAIIADGCWLDESLGDLNLFAERVLTDDVQVWGNGVDFDNVILRNAYNAVNLEPFWKRWNNRGVRTIVELGRNTGIDPKRTLAFEGEPHNALDDAIHQAKYVSIIHQHLIKPVNDDI
ncbi:3'-5' exonuclease [Providencia sneebia]|uniref:Phage protein n=1 Tax=Providencia sneebia DSM 19967 TaxID=1141660 RepID=K8WDM1_9GAMM|nr:3'-5' exonuclease [Providencia sneebia]EKT55501.1 phage protein [Providencia sneebia DSM 19967]EKT55557.1 phage protein [Providencia sneebia DSM 19967]